MSARSPLAVSGVAVAAARVCVGGGAALSCAMSSRTVLTVAAPPIALTARSTVVSAPRTVPRRFRTLTTLTARPACADALILAARLTIFINQQPRCHDVDARSPKWVIAAANRGKAQTEEVQEVLKGPSRSCRERRATPLTAGR